jgi:hypothetical protein
LIDFFGASWPRLMAQESVAAKYLQQIGFAIVAAALSGVSYMALETSQRSSIR